MKQGSKNKNVNPLVSVIMPFFNAEEFISEAIESVINQTYKHWELLLVDDGSDDNSSEIACRFVRSDPVRIKYHTHSDRGNHGISTSINLALNYSIGELIALLDADDIWLANKLSDQVALMARESDASLLFGLTMRWYSWSDGPTNQRKDFAPDIGLELNRLYSPPDLFAPFFLNQCAYPPATCSVLMRREAVLSVGGFEDRFTGLYSDQAFFAKMSLKVPIYIADQCWDKYRQHESSMCAAAVDSANKTHAIFLSWLMEFFENEKIGVPALAIELRWAFLPYRNKALHGLISLLKRIFPLSFRRRIWRSWTERRIKHA